jgi:hypothetical protein
MDSMDDMDGGQLTGLNRKGFLEFSEKWSIAEWL